uniref:Reverse transcriptase domain-containing protein n=1 Tax=Heterorhabditis bacteriophora TaxID=37862 RepID=A0A1I7XHE4_HETBA
MQTVVTMIEAILKTRPITHINPADITVCPIRPMDFLSQKISFSLSVGDSENYYDPDYNYHAINTVNQAKEVLQNINRGPNGRTLHRPINKLYPMEIRATSPLGIVTTTNMHGDPNLEQEDEEIIDDDSPTCMIASKEYVKREKK